MIIGVCAMDAKARSKPMRNILDRLSSSTNENLLPTFEIIIFGDQTILEDPIETWPLCDVLIAFYSRGFPLLKAISYVKLRRPFCVNDLQLASLLLDRRIVMDILAAIDVPTPRRIVISQDGGPTVLSEEIGEIVSRDFGLLYDVTPRRRSTQMKVELVDGGDVLQLIDKETNSPITCIRKPFMEKPVDAEDHNIHLYYEGGGCRRLFRKVANKSSEFIPDASEVRQGSFIYEEFLPPDDCEDVKVYTVGLDYASPTVDGVVRRNAEGKELRDVTQMTDEEREMARRICIAFGQTICGFDILRASITRLVSPATPVSAAPTPTGNGPWKLKAFVCAFRHGDRTPKNKIKVTLLQSEISLEEGVVRERSVLQSILTRIEEALGKSQSGGELRRLHTVLREKIDVPGTKLQVRRSVNPKNDPINDDTTLQQVIVKWGGEFTHAGRHQSKDLGENMRKDLLLLNRRIFDDVRVGVSVERRVQATADVFSKSLLATAELPPNLIISMPRLLDESTVEKEDVMRIKTELGKNLVSSPLFHRLQECLRMQKDLLTEYFMTMLPDNKLNHPVTVRECSESVAIFKERWERHFEDLLHPSLEQKGVDPSRISDLYDSLKYDALHHRLLLTQVLTRPDRAESTKALEDLYSCAQGLFDHIAPREYGADGLGRRLLGRQISGLLLDRIIADLSAALYAPLGLTSSRLYFTKESHMTALFNLLKESSLPLQITVTGEEADEMNELDYLSHICFELYERVKVLPAPISTPIAAPTCTVAMNGDEIRMTPSPSPHPEESITIVARRGSHGSRASGEFSSIPEDVPQSLSTTIGTSSIEAPSPLSANTAPNPVLSPTSPITGSIVTSVQHSIRIGLSNGAHDTRLLHLQLDERHALSVGPKRWLTDHLPANRVLDALISVLRNNNHGDCAGDEEENGGSSERDYPYPYYQLQFPGDDLGRFSALSIGSRRSSTS